MTDTTAPPLLELLVKETGERYQILEDGRYLVSGPDGVPHETPPMSKIDGGTRRITARGLGRLRQAIAAVGFGSLPDTVPGISALPAGMRPTGSGRFEPRTFIFSSGSSGNTKSVSVEADSRLARSFGVLTPLWLALDEEALGGWRHE